jgi:hypothetical protein
VTPNELLQPRVAIRNFPTSLVVGFVTHYKLVNLDDPVLDILRKSALCEELEQVGVQLRVVCGIRPMPISDSGASRSPNPAQADH